MEHQEGDIADGPNGSTAIFTNGSWKIQPSGPGVSEDIAKSIKPAAIRGGVMAGTALPGIYDMAVPTAVGAGIPKTAQWLADKLPDSWGVGDAIRPVTSAVNEAYTKARDFVDKSRREGVTGSSLTGKATVPPGRIGSHTYGNVMQDVEKKTGPLYQAETLPGKLVQGAVEAAPAIAGGNWIKGLGSVAGSELAGHATEGTWAEPYAKIAAGFLGNFAPTGKKAPNLLFPSTAENKALVDVVKPHVPGLTAGQITGNPTLQKIEGTAGLSTQPQLAQASSHALSTAGVNTPASKQGLANLDELTAAGRAAGQTKSDIFSQNQLRMDKTFDKDLAAASKAAGRMRTPASGQLNDTQKLRQELADVHDRILHEPTVGRAAPGNRYTSMLGSTAEEVMNDLSGLVKRGHKAGASRVAQAAHDTGTALRNAMDRSLVGTPHEGALGPLREQYTNFKAIDNVARKQGSGAVLPMDKVYAALLKSKNPNAPQMPLGQFTNAAEKIGVGKDLPKFNLKDALLPGVLGGLATAGTGSMLHGANPEMTGGEFLSGFFGTPAAAYMLAKYGGKALTGPRMQKHLPNAGSDRNQMARLLLTQGAPRAQAAVAASE